MRPRPHPAIWLSALAIGGFQLVGSFGAADNQPDRTPLDALAVVLILLGPAALAVRDRWPLLAVVVSTGATITYLGLGYPYGPIFLSVVVAIVTAVLAGRRRAVWALSGLGFAGYVVAARLDPNRGEGSLLLKASVVAAWLLVVLAVAELVRTRRDTRREHARAEEEERQRRAGEQRLELAQELHDVLAHHISLINVQAGVALHLIDEQPERARPALAEIKAASREALRELRGALDILRRGEAAPRAPAPRLAELDRLVANVAASGLDVTLDGGDRPAELPAAVELAAYRIVQEALTNVSRHARARSARVTVRYGDDVTIEVVDDGVGATGTVEGGNGIRGMRERATALGGSLEAGTHPGGGFRVAARLPVRERAVS
jgi:signal transduction histidine kinase